MLLLTAVFSGACSPEGPVETRLVSRVWPDTIETCGDQLICQVELPGQTFRVADGRSATLEPYDVEWTVERLGRGEVECAGEQIRTFDNGYRLVDAGPDRSRTLVFDDGSGVDLVLESWVNVFDRCVEAVGRWIGLAGTFEGRSGTYRWTDDAHVQVELVITDS